MKLLQNYIINETLKKTNDIIVYKAKHINSGTIYAIKLVKRSTKTPNSIYKESINHDNIIKCFATPEIKLNDIFYHMYVLEWANGGSLRDLLNKQKSIKLKHIFQLLNAIDYLHKQKIIHGDLKPENILFKTTENKSILKISDYNTQISKENHIAITPEYSPPEYKSYNTKSDMWAIGCLFYEFYFKNQPFGSRNTGDSINLILKNIASKPLPKKILKLPEPFRYIIFKSLKKNPEDCFNNMTEIIDILTKKTTFFKRLNYKVQYLKAIINGEIE